MSSDFLAPRPKNCCCKSDVGCCKSDSDTCKQRNINEKKRKVRCGKSAIGCLKLHTCVRTLSDIQNILLRYYKNARIYNLIKSNIQLRKMYVQNANSHIQVVKVNFILQAQCPIWFGLLSSFFCKKLLRVLLIS